MLCEIMCTPVSNVVHRDVLKLVHDVAIVVQQSFVRKYEV